MGSAPPVDAPAPGPAISNASEGGFADDPSSSTLCGFKFPPFPFFKLGFKIPSGLKFPPGLPIPHVGLAINCNASNPFDFTSKVTWGGGRSPNGYPDPDAVEQANS